MITNYFKSVNKYPSTSKPFHEAISQQNKQARINFVSFNILTLDNGHRLQEISRKLKANNIHVAAIQGTCWQVSNAWEVGDYGVFHDGKLLGQQHKHAGVMLLIHKSLTISRTVRTYSVTQGRTIAVRISDRSNDLTLISSYIPTEESRLSGSVWSQLSKFMQQLPRRTTAIVGIDSNAHVDLEHQSSHWQSKVIAHGTNPEHQQTNKNGEMLLNLLQQHSMYMADTRNQNNCWTHMAPDGKTVSYIDHILVPMQLQGQVENNVGVDYRNVLELRREGTCIDHLPICVTVRVPFKWKSKEARTLPLWDQRELTKAAQAWEIHENNKMRKQPISEDAERVQQAIALRDRIAERLAQYQMPITRNKLQTFPCGVDPERHGGWNCDLDKHSQALEDITNESIAEIFPFTRSVTIKQSYIDNALADQIEIRQKMWKDILTLSNQAMAVSPFSNVKSIFHAWKLYVLWFRQKRIVNRQIKHAKKSELEQLLEGTLDVDPNDYIKQREKFQVIRKLAPKPRGAKQTLRTQDGGYAHNTRQETSVYDHLVATTWKGQRIDENEGRMGLGQDRRLAKTPLLLDTTTADVRAAQRKCKVGKAMKKGTRPAEAFLIAGDITAMHDLKLWNGIAYQRTQPQNWWVSDVVMIPKPGKDPSILPNRRGINKIDSGLKSFSSYVQHESTPFVQRDSAGEWGGLKHKSIKQPLLVVDIMLDRTRRTKTNLAIFAGDINKAFDSADHSKLNEALPKFIDHPVWPCLIEDRHERIFFRFTLEDGSEIVYHIPQGAVQGCSLGPMAFTLYYRAFVRHLNRHREEFMHKIMSFTVDPSRLMQHVDKHERRGTSSTSGIADSQQHCEWMREIDNSKLLYIDDHLEMWTFDSIGYLKRIFSPLITAQKEYNLTTNFKKTQFSIITRGKQSRKRLKSFGNTYTISKGQPIPLTKQILYLGSIYSTNGSNRPAIRHRMQLAQTAHARMTPKIYRSNAYSPHLKCRLFEQYELTVLLSGLDTRVMGKGDLDILERFQMKCVRHITKSQAHVTKESNKRLRQRMNTPTIASRMQVSRLNFYRGVFQYPQTNAQVIAMLFGTSAWDAKPPTVKTSKHMKQLHNDICALHAAVTAKNGLPPGLFPKDWDSDFVNPAMQGWLMQCTSTDVKTLHCYQTETERIRHIKQQVRQYQAAEGTHECDMCELAFATKQALSVHKWSCHRVRNPYRAQVDGPTCPGCGTNFTCKINAQSHWSKQVCVRSGAATRTFEQIEADRNAVTAAN